MDHLVVHKPPVSNHWPKIWQHSILTAYKFRTLILNTKVFCEVPYLIVQRDYVANR